MAKPPKKPKDPARPTRAKAARPDAAAADPALDALLNPGIGRGTAGLGSGTGLQPPPDNSFDRRADFSAAHKARKSARGFGEAPQSDYTGSPISGLDPQLAKELGLGSDDDTSSPSSAGGGSRAASARGGVQSSEASSPPPADAARRRPPPSRGR